MMPLMHTHRLLSVRTLAFTLVLAFALVSLPVARAETYTEFVTTDGFGAYYQDTKPGDLLEFDFSTIVETGTYEIRQSPSGNCSDISGGKYIRMCVALCNV